MSVSWRLFILRLAAACAAPPDPVPPVLPGELPPPCDALASHSYLIDELGVPAAFGSDLVPRYDVDLNDPPDGSQDIHNYPYTYMVLLTPALPDAIQRAVRQQHVLWTVTLEVCTDGSGFARMLLRRGRSYAEQPAPGTVEVLDDGAIWAVGENRHGTYYFEHGMGHGPAALSADVAADTSETAWVRGFQVTMTAGLLSRDGTLVLRGGLALAYEAEPARYPMAAATGRTLTKALADDPTCSRTTECMSDFLKTLLPLDRNDDRRFSEEEIIESLDVRFNFVPNLDLLAPFAGDLVYWPGFDRISETLGNSYQFAAREVNVNVVTP